MMTTFKQWRSVLSTPLYQMLMNGEGRRVLELLSNGQISIGKAAEAVAELAAGYTPSLLRRKRRIK